MLITRFIIEIILRLENVFNDYRHVNKCYQLFENVCKYLQNFENVYKCLKVFRMFKTVQKCLKMFEKKTMIRNVSINSKMFENAFKTF